MEGPAITAIIAIALGFWSVGILCGLLLAILILKMYKALITSPVAPAVPSDVMSKLDTALKSVQPQLEAFVSLLKQLQKEKT